MCHTCKRQTPSELFQQQVAETQLRLPYTKKGMKVEVEQDSGAQTIWFGLYPPFLSWLHPMQAPHFWEEKNGPGSSGT